MVETGGSMDNPDEPSALLPEQRLLSLDAYLEMQRAIGNETRFRILGAFEGPSQFTVKSIIRSRHP